METSPVELLMLICLLAVLLCAFYMYKKLSKRIDSMDGTSMFAPSESEYLVESNSDWAVASNPTPLRNFCPYSIHVTNMGDQIKRCTLFGMAKHLKKPNYGSDKDIVITPGHGVEYDELLIQSGLKPFAISHIVIDFMHRNQLSNPIYFISWDANGQMLTETVIPDDYVVGDKWQRVVIPKKWDVEQGTYIQFSLHGHTSVNLKIYASRRIIPARGLHDMNTVVDYSTYSDLQGLMEPKIQFNQKQDDNTDTNPKSKSN